MGGVSRRSFLKSTIPAAGMLAASGRMNAENASPVFPAETFGRIQPIPSKQIDASPLGVGFEVLDRRRFDPERAYPHLAKLGVKWARCQTGWNRCERKRGEFTFGWLDEVVDSLLEIGIQPWFNLGYGNKLYTPEKPDDYSVGWAPVFSDEAQEAWLRFVRKISEHFADRVRHWEIWNEPNISGFWKPNKPNPADYARLVAATAPEIRKRVPNAVIIGGALAGIKLSYLEGCFESGLAEHVDKISYHPYRPAPESNYEKEIDALRALIARYNKGIEIWQGENGCPSKGGEGSAGALSNLDWNETRQAKWLLRRILSDLRLGVEMTSYFHTIDLVGYRGKTNFKGLLRGDDYTPKPAYHAYQSLCALFDARTNRADFKLELVGQKKVNLQEGHFVRNGRAICAYWYPADLMKDWEVRRIDIRLTESADASMPDPVLVDPLSGMVYRLEGATRKNGAMAFLSLPLLDYPLLIADRSSMLGA